MKRILKASLAFAMVAAALSSCATADKFRIMERKNEHTAAPVKVVVRDFTDLRGRENKPVKGNHGIPLVFWESYLNDRHDNTFSSSVEPFPTLLAKGAAERINEAGVFSSTEYKAEPGTFGEHDLELKGTIHTLRSTGSVTSYGLWFVGTWISYLGAPRWSRRWEVDVEYQLVNAYTGEPFGDPVRVTETTPRKRYSRYTTYGESADLYKVLTGVYDNFIDASWSKLPDSKDVVWANIKSEGEKLVLARQRDEELAKKGTPPVFSFLAPASGSAVRTPAVAIRWGISSPGGLKTAALVANNKPVELGIDVLSLVSPDSAPKSIAAQETSVPLVLGANKLTALVADHRGNEERASFEVTRLPAQLTPARRHALVITIGDAKIQKAASDVTTVLTNPLLGQFAEADVTTITKDSLTGAELTAAIRSFGSKPLAGELAFIYVSAPGNWENRTIADGLTLPDFISTTSQSLATNQVVLLTDINWSGEKGTESLEDTIGDVPPGMAFLLTTSTGGPTPLAGDTTALASTFARTITGEAGSTSRLTLGRLMDELLVTGHESHITPLVLGRFNQSITMVERE